MRAAMALATKAMGTPVIACTAVQSEPPIARRCSSAPEMPALEPDAFSVGSPDSEDMRGVSLSSQRRAADRRGWLRGALCCKHLAIHAITCFGDAFPGQELLDTLAALGHQLRMASRIGQHLADSVP